MFAECLLDFAEILLPIDFHFFFRYEPRAVGTPRISLNFISKIEKSNPEIIIILKNFDDKLPNFWTRCLRIVDRNLFTPGAYVNRGGLAGRPRTRDLARGNEGSGHGCDRCASLSWDDTCKRALHTCISFKLTISCTMVHRCSPRYVAGQDSR